MSRFITPGTTEITLDNGDVLIVRTRLNAGQMRARHMRMYSMSDDGTAPRLKLNEVGLATVLAYLVDWRLHDDDVPIAGLDGDDLAAILDNLAPEDFLEVRQAIDAHEERGDAKRAEKKTILAGGNTSSPISISRGVAIGATSG